MSKIILLVLLLIAAVVIVPPLREQARPHVQFAFDPFYEWSARNRVKDLAKLVRQQQDLGHPVPSPDQFAGYVERRDFQTNASIDPWGNPYYLLMGRGTFQVGSSGKDGTVGTEDDIVSAEETLKKTDRRDRRRRSAR